MSKETIKTCKVTSENSSNLTLQDRAGIAALIRRIFCGKKELYLKPCPFCGQNAFLDLRTNKDGEEVFTLGCTQCEFEPFTMGNIQNLTKSATAWNTRKYK